MSKVPMSKVIKAKFSCSVSDLAVYRFKTRNSSNAKYGLLPSLELTQAMVLKPEIATKVAIWLSFTCGVTPKLSLYGFKTRKNANLIRKFVRGKHERGVALSRNRAMSFRPMLFSNRYPLM